MTCYNHSTGEVWEEGSGETHCLYANMTVEDEDSGESYEVKLRNAVDIGFQVFARDDGAVPEAVREYARDNSPIFTGHRQFESDGKSVW